MTDDNTPLTAYAGLGGIAACCLVLELLGGAAILTGVATAIGLSTGMTYLVVIGFVGLAVTGMAYLYRRRTAG